MIGILLIHIQMEGINRDSEANSTLILGTEERISQPLVQHEQVHQEKLPAEPPAQKQRLQSLDIYRGLTMVGMILVDNMGPVHNPPWFLDHAEWNGVTPADLIFPAFLFIMGMAVPLAVSKNRPVRIKNIIRILALFAIGFFLNLLNKKFNFNRVRIPGILQCLSICYGLMLLIHVSTGYGATRMRKFLGFLIVFLLLAAYTVIMLLWDGGNEQGCSKDNHLSEQCNWAGWVDRKVFTTHHILRGTNTDPEGLVSNVGALATVYGGYFYSLLMKKSKASPELFALQWLGLSIIIGLLSLPLQLLMPFNKKIYSASFTLLAIGVSGGVLTIFYAITDIMPARRPGTRKCVDIIVAPLRWLGLNPLAVFVGMDLLAILMVTYIKIKDRSLWHLFFDNAFKTWIHDSAVAATVFACFFLLLWTAVAGIMHRFKLYIRL